MKRELVVNVTGFSGSGKTTIAYEISKHLRSLGFEVEFSDSEMNPVTLIDYQDGRLEVMKDKVKINIKQTQLQRNHFDGSLK
jgi:uridine kinase